MDDRKRLKLLPEVLPAPSPIRAGESAESGPRARTREHLQKILAAAALTGVIACTKSDAGYGVVDPMPTPADASGPPPPPDVSDGSAPREGGAGSTTSVVPVEARPVPYGVVDPLPMPPPDAGRHGVTKDAGAKPGPPACDPPFTVDAKGNKHFKPECL
jgi:hypothetical protein